MLFMVSMVKKYRTATIATARRWDFDSVSTMKSMKDMKTGKKNSGRLRTTIGGRIDPSRKHGSRTQSSTEIEYEYECDKVKPAFVVKPVRAVGMPDHTLQLPNRGQSNCGAGSHGLPARATNRRRLR